MKPSSYMQSVIELGVIMWCMTSQFCYDCFKNVNLLHHHWYIRKLFEHKVNTVFILWNFIRWTTRWTQKSAPSWAEPHGSPQNAHTSQEYPHLLWDIPVWVQITLTSITSLISCNPSVIFTSKLNFFFRAKCYIYCSIYAFLKHLMYKTGLFILGSGLSFIASLTKFLSVTSLTPFFSHALWFYCTILHSMLIFRNIYALLWWR